MSKIKKIEPEGFIENLYLIKQETKGLPGCMWQVRIKHTHYCLVAVGTKEHALECVTTIVKRYKTFPVLQKLILKDYHYNRNTSKTDLMKYQKKYMEEAPYNASDLREAVYQAVKTYVPERTPIQIKRNSISIERKSINDIENLLNQKSQNKAYLR